MSKRPRMTTSKKRNWHTVSVNGQNPVIYVEPKRGPNFQKKKK